MPKESGAVRFPDWLLVYGDTSYRGPCPTEAVEQVTFFARARRHTGLAVHVKNEGKRTHYQALHDKSEGLTTGASDIIIPGNPAFVCEMKRRDHTKSRWQDGQLEYLKEAHERGCFACVALGADAAMQAYVAHCTKAGYYLDSNKEEL